MPNENGYSVRLYTSYLGVFVGLSIALSGVYLLLIGRKSSISKIPPRVV
jgi:hypothetical protein